MKIFGIALDPLNSPERLNLKLNYLSYITNIPGKRDLYLDPYDLIKDHLQKESQLLNNGTWAGKIPIESWLTPKPQLRDAFLLSLLNFYNFLNKNGCLKYTEKVSNFVEKKIFPHKPVMIGVDHSLTGGVLTALSRRYPNLNVIILDSHFDVLKYHGMISQRQDRDGTKTSGKVDSDQDRFIYECGNFLSYILEKGIIQPRNLWVLGVNEILEMNDSPGDDKFSLMDKEEMRKWIRRGVHVAYKKEVISNSFKISLSGPTYISVDMDVGSLASIYSARFMNCFGFTYQEFLETLSELSRIIRESEVPLTGMDIMEIDIHLLEATSFSKFTDCTRSIVRDIFSIFSELLHNDNYGQWKINI